MTVGLSAWIERHTLDKWTSCIKPPSGEGQYIVAASVNGSYALVDAFGFFENQNQTQSDHHASTTCVLSWLEIRYSLLTDKQINAAWLYLPKTTCDGR
jgi:hypothetical protein